MAIHSTVLACSIPGIGEPGGLPSIGSHSQTRLKWQQQQQQWHFWTSQVVPVVKNLTANETGFNSKRLGFDPWVRKIPWRRPLPPPPVLLPVDSHGQEPWGLQVFGFILQGMNTTCSEKGVFTMNPRRMTCGEVCSSTHLREKQFPRLLETTYIFQYQNLTCIF